ncbi:MAG: ribonuclease catalytic domain-containing protein, partial [bacterium]
MQAINWMREILRIGEVTAIPNEMEDLVRRVEDFLKRREGTQVQAWLSEVSPDLTPVEAAIELLALTGRLREDAHHLLIAAGIEERFPHEVSQQCSRIRPYRANSGRPDYSDRLTFTIDDEDTNELDDALTLEMRDDGVGVGIHIADVAYFVQKDDLLDREALRRGTSVYLPDRTVNMFPPHLASDLASLCANELRPAMSFLIEVSREGQIRDWRVERSQILVDHRLSYDDADNLILGESDGSLSEPLKELSALSRRIAAERQAKGALTINRPELKIRVENG